MNTALITALVLTFLAFLIHTFVGDKELKINEPAEGAENYEQKREKWTMARCGWHWISVDLLFSSVVLALVNFTDVLDNERMLLQMLALYFLAYAVVWLFTIIISKRFSKNYLKLGQWMLLLLISGLIYYGAS